MEKVTILGVPYEVDFTTDKEDKCLVEKSGYCDYTNKKISIETQYDNAEVENMDVVIRQTLRHEIIHGFLFESGLHLESWGTNEEIVDWIALQFPKMLEAFKEVGLFADESNALAESEALKHRIIADADEQARLWADRIKEIKTDNKRLLKSNNTFIERIKALEDRIENLKNEKEALKKKVEELQKKPRRRRPPKEIHEAAVDILNIKD